MTLAQYVHGFGYQVSDLTPEELKEVKEELAAANRGEDVLDGVLIGKKQNDIFNEIREGL